MCVLRAYGANFDPAAYLSGGSLLKSIVIRQPGDPVYDRRLARGKGAEKGFHVGVSDRPPSDWDGQVQDATRFLRAHEGELRSLRARSDVTSLHLDFPTEANPAERNVIIWGQGFPLEFMRAAADAGVDVYVTVYFATTEGAQQDDESRA